MEGGCYFTDAARVTSSVTSQVLQVTSEVPPSNLLRAGISTRAVMVDMLWADKPRVDHHHDDD